MTETLQDLELQLREKEQVIEALTERLEQAAEQLDRIRRTGGDRGARIGGGGIPAEMVEQQRTLTEELQQALQQWEAMQAAATLGRIEIQLTELRDLVAERLTPDHANAPGSHPREPRRQRQSSPQPVAYSAGGGYERLKAELLGDSEEAPTEAERHDRAPGAVTEPDGQLEEAPQPVDRSVSDPEVLHDAIEARDGYIACLIRRLRSAEARSAGPVDWSALADVPDELRERLEQLSRSLDERLRMAEVELSLERARLSREESRLRISEQLIEKEKRRLAQQGAHIERLPAIEHAGDKGGRWRKLLGMGGSGDEA